LHYFEFNNIHALFLDLSKDLFL